MLPDDAKALRDPDPRSRRGRGMRHFLLGLALWAAPSFADPVAVTQPEGVLHGFVKLSRLDGTRIADGELIQTVDGERVTSRLLLKFLDGSRCDETTVFSQKGHFRLIRDELVQKGPSFPHPVEVTIDVPAGKVTVKADGKVHEEQVDMPADLANGLLPVLVKQGTASSVSMLVLAPKPRFVKLLPTAAGEARFKIGGTAHTATDYAVKIELGGVTGVVAPLVGKQPQDAHVWILRGDAPAFVKSEAPMFQDGPVWRMELASPVFQGAPVKRAR